MTFAAGKMLNRSTMSGPTMRDTETTAFNGTIVLFWERTKTWRRSSGEVRNSPSDDRLTR